MTTTPRLIAALALAGLLLAPGEATAQQQPEPGAQPPPATAASPQRARQPRPGTATEQLFEAINQGEMEDVRAAVAAGADIGARNVLGLTPMDLAVDLGRTDVALYLLSLGRVRERPLAPLPQDTSAQRDAARSAAQQRRAEDAAIEAALRQRGPSVSGQGIVAVAPLWAGNGGAPNPAVGFLGFDAGRPAGAAPPRQAQPRQQAPTRTR
ncbi:MAG: ankyrin repeat domain-containing protein [Rubritepida sp.]|jgi:hypothetical protein|nr:ankyrin repeat domain-containing protein [Rubritepida sp.]